MTAAVSLTAPQFSSTFRPVGEAARHAEDLGFDGFFLFDHLIPLDEPSRPVLELAATLGAVAAATERISIGSLVMRAPLRGATLSAAAARTVGMIAPGRAIIGLGAGDSFTADEDHRYGRRTQTLDERLEVVAETLAASEDAGVQRWVGGLHPRILELAATGDGWNGWEVDRSRLVDAIPRLPAGRAGYTVSWGGSVVMGRDRGDLDAILQERGGRGGTITGTDVQVRAHLRSLVDAGVDHLVLSVLPNRPERWESFAQAVLGKVS